MQGEINMTFYEWITSSYSPNPSVNGQWGLLHILTLVACAGIILTLTFIFRKKSVPTKRIVIFSLVGLILLFELTRRCLNIYKTTDYSFHSILHIMLPRPWCAISCWALILSTFINKKFFYNIASITALLCAIIFFAYPGVGFNNKYILFENLYSIVTHALLLVTSITLITLNFTKFEYKTIWKELICYAVIFAYAFLEIFVLKIEGDPLYFMPEGDIQEILGVPYAVYLLLYISFIIIYTNIFYLIGDRKNVLKKRKK